MKANDCVCPKCGNDRIIAFNPDISRIFGVLWLKCPLCGFDAILKEDDINPFKEEE